MSAILPMPFADSRESLLAEVAAQVRDNTPDGVIEGIAVQVHTAREARSRIEVEGSVVRDMKGAVVPHPAIDIEASAIKLYTALLDKHGRNDKRRR